jgi:molybdenum cofactor synthesis domain-containing protein
MSAPKPVTACAIVIGNEILSGRTADQNLAFLGANLDQCGVVLREARVVQDVEEDIVAAVNDCRARHDYVFTSGGIGPTHDDITTASIARAFGVAVVRSPEAVARLRAYYEAGQLSAARLRMAEVPEGAVLIDNPVSAAPGYRMENVYVFAGVPEILQAMFQSIRHELSGGDPILTEAVTATLPESVIAAGLAKVQAAFPDITIGSYPFHRAERFGTTLVLRGTAPARLALARAAVEELVEDTAAGGAAGV